MNYLEAWVGRNEGRDQTVGGLWYSPVHHFAVLEEEALLRRNVSELEEAETKYPEDKNLLVKVSEKKNRCEVYSIQGRQEIQASSEWQVDAVILHTQPPGESGRSSPT